MKEAQYIKKIKSLWPTEGEASVDTLLFVARALSDYPSSYKLHIYMGCLIQLGPEDSPYTLEDARDHFISATNIDPSNLEGFKELGYYYDVIEDDSKTGRKYFDKARRLKKKSEPAG